MATSKQAGAKRVGLTQLLTEEELAKLRPRRKFVLDLEAEAKSKNVSVKDALDLGGKYYDEYGRTRMWGIINWINCCTYGDCRARRRVSHGIYCPSLTGFNKCKKHAESKTAPAIQQGLGKYFS